MINRFLYDNLISFIGAWFLFLITLSLWYWVACIINMIDIKKHSIWYHNDFFQPFNELRWTYWAR